MAVIPIRIKRGTRAQVVTAAGNSGLAEGEPYLLTDEDRLTVGTAPDAFVAMAKQGEHSPRVVTATYSASGAIAPTDNVAVVDSASSLAMTLAAGSVDGHVLEIKRLGSGSVTITLHLDGNADYPIIGDSADRKESLRLIWSASRLTWLAM